MRAHLDHMAQQVEKRKSTVCNTRSGLVWPSQIGSRNPGPLGGKFSHEVGDITARGPRGGLHITSEAQERSAGIMALGLQESKFWVRRNSI